MKLPGIGLDIDQPEDVDAFMRAEPHMATRALALLSETVGVTPSPTLPRA